MTYWAFACKTETLGSLCSDALLIPTNQSQSQNQVMHEQNFKDPLSSTCPLCSERRVLTWNQRFIRGLGSIPTGGNILPLGFFFVFT